MLRFIQIHSVVSEEMFEKLLTMTMTTAKMKGIPHKTADFLGVAPLTPYYSKTVRNTCIWNLTEKTHARIFMRNPIKKFRNQTKNKKKLNFLGIAQLRPPIYWKQSKIHKIFWYICLPEVIEEHNKKTNN